jgi:hypothetical protein
VKDLDYNKFPKHYRNVNLGYVISEKKLFGQEDEEYSAKKIFIDRFGVFVN